MVVSHTQSMYEQFSDLQTQLAVTHLSPPVSAYENDNLSNVYFDQDEDDDDGDANDDPDADE